MYLFLFFTFLASTSDFLVPAWFDPKIDKTTTAKIESDGILILATNIMADDRYSMFDIEITNKTKNALPVDCAVMYILTTKEPFPEGLDAKENAEFENRISKRYRLSEDAIKGLNNKSDNGLKDAGLVLNIISAGLLLFDAVADVSDHHSEWTPSRARLSLGRDLAVATSLVAADVVNHINAYSSIENRRFLPALELLNNRILKPGESVRGVIYFPSGGLEFSRLIIPIGNTDFTFDFRRATREDEQAILRFR
jgi:hypothetical protein